MIFKKKKINLTIDLCFIGYVLFIIAFNFITALNGTNGSLSFGEINLNGSIEMFINLAMMMFITIFFTIITNFLVIIGYIGIRLAVKAYVKDKLNSNDFGKYKDYYREILSNYSPGELSYIDNFEFNYDRVLVATIFNLKLKKYISLNNDITIINSNLEKLDANEKYVMDNFGHINSFVFKEKVINDALNAGLIETQKDLRQKTIKRVLKLFLIYIIISILFGFSIFLTVNLINANVTIGIIIALLVLTPLFIITFFFPLFSVIYFLTYNIFNKLSPYVRTEKGNDSNRMLEGLKNYFKDFSNIETRKKEELSIWEEYLIYSILFGLNDDIVNETKDLYKLG